MSKLKALATDTLDQLRNSIGENLQRYTAGDFDELAMENGWAVDVDVEVDTEALSALSGNDETPEQAAINSMVVWNALKGMTPNLASEERIWTRLCHVECLPYARARWIADAGGKDEKIAAIGTHLFGKGQNGIRDDNAISRLWWNAHVARLAMPDDMEGALRLILKTTDYRLNLVERPVLTSRIPVIAGILRRLAKETWLNDQDNFRAFMRAINRLGGGIVFEVLSEAEVDDFMTVCMEDARKELERPAEAA